MKPTKQNRPGREIVKLLKEGMRPKDIKNKLKVTGATITYWKKKLGLPASKRGRPPLKNGEHGKNFKTDVRKFVKKMRHEGKTFREIEETLQFFWTAD